ncbi:MAG: hypothetical protein M1823_001516 [Watsoniomyces obsoletus]|nr:MAG: hypothetical protein M1823_001516 [Watsoniomyces obsoletus]
MATPPNGPQGQPTPQQLHAMRQQLAAEAAQHKMSIDQYINHLKAQAMKQHAQQQQAQAQKQQEHAEDEQRVQNAEPGPPTPEALALAKFLRGQDLKTRTCILNGQRKDMFKVKRAIRALHSPAYIKARSKNPTLLPEVTDRVTAENTLKLLPRSLLALRVSKIDSVEGHSQGGGSKTKKRIKGLWTVKIEQHQEMDDMEHYIWLYEGPQWKQKLYAVGALVILMALVLFPLWPVKLRIGVWYLSMGMLGLIGLFFAMSIFRLILFCVTLFAVPPGLWLYPNLFEDVGFFDSFRPVWGWQEEKKKKKGKKAAGLAAKGDDGKAKTTSSEKETAGDANGTPSAAKVTPAAGLRDLTSRVEEVEEDDD